MKRIVASSFVVLGACLPDAPDTPSFQQDVMPILAANCVRCHGTPAIGGAPEWFRLDAYSTAVLVPATLPPDDPQCTQGSAPPECADQVLAGANALSATIAERVVDEARPMPPRFGLEEYQIETLQRWAQLGAPLGRARPENRPPTATLDDIAIEETQVRLIIRASDPDRDVVGGVLVASRPGQEIVIGAFGSGRGELRWETTGVVPGTYSLHAHLEDGGATENVPLGTLQVGAP